MSGKYKKFLELMGEIVDLEATESLLSWDQSTYMPPGGASVRAMQRSTINRLAHEMTISEELATAFDAAKVEIGDKDPDSDEARVIRKAERDFERKRKVPPEWVGEFYHTKSLSNQAWEKARADSDFAHFQPHLEKIVDLRRQYVEFFVPYDHPYDPLLEYFEPGMKTVEVKSIFDELRPQQVKLVQEIAEHGTPVDDSVLHQPFDERKQWDFGVEVIKALGYDFERGRQDKTAHPFTTSFGINDVRITTRFDANYIGTALFGTMHEAGHGMYNQGIKPVFDRTSLSPLVEGDSHGIHESQSRMIENLVGRSRGFWVGFYPRLQEIFPSQLKDVDLHTFYRAINKVEPSLIRVEADEATYNLHIMLRFEIELALMESKLEVSDLPEVWNSKMKEYLGISPPDDAKGVLQDIHWSIGYIGYFPTYSLGTIMACQWWKKIEEDIPDLSQQIEGREFGDLHAWLRENIHQHGAKFDPAELLQRVTGRSLTAEPYLHYLREKYSEIYQL